MAEPSKNDVTGDLLATKPSTDAYKEGIERIFGKKERVQWVPPPLPEEPKKEDAQ